MLQVSQVLRFFDVHSGQTGVVTGIAQPTSVSFGRSDTNTLCHRVHTVGTGRVSCHPGPWRRGGGPRPWNRSHDPTRPVEVWSIYDHTRTFTLTEHEGPYRAPFQKKSRRPKNTCITRTSDRETHRLRLAQLKPPTGKHTDYRRTEEHGKGRPS